MNTQDRYEETDPDAILQAYWVSLLQLIGGSICHVASR